MLFQASSAYAQQAKADSILVRQFSGGCQKDDLTRCQTPRSKLLLAVLYVVINAYFMINLQAIYEIVCGEEDLVNDLSMIQKNYSDPLMHLNILNHAEVYV